MHALDSAAKGNGVRIAAALLLGLAVLLPVRALAAGLAADSALIPRLVPGILLFKGLLVLHALALLLVWERRRRADPQDRTSPATVKGPDLEQRTWLVVLGLLGIGVLFRTVSLDNGLWHDEIATLVSYVRRPVTEIISIYNSQNQHPLYSLVARASVSLFGDSAWSLRLPAAVFGVASLAATFWFAALISSRTEALLAVALLTTSYHHIWFSQNARGYTLLLCLTLVGTGIFLRLIRSPGRGWGAVVAYATVMALAVYTHLSAAIIVLSHAAVWAATALRARQSSGRVLDLRPAGAVILAATLSLQLYAIVMPQLLETLLGARPVQAAVITVWRSPLWLVGETIRGLSRGLPGGWLALVGGMLIVGAGAASYLKRDHVALALMTVPPLAVAAIMILLEHNLWPRLFFFAAAFAVLIVVRGVHVVAEALVPRLGPALATATLLVAIAGNALTAPRAWGPKQDFRGALAWVERERSPQDAVVALGLSDLALIEYLRADWAAPRTAAELQGIEERHVRTWAVYTFPTHLASMYPEVNTRLRGYRVAAEFPGTLGGGTVYVMVSR